MAAGDRCEGRDQQVEALLAREPAGGGHDRRLERRGAAVMGRGRVRDPLDPQPGELAVVGAVALGERHERVEVGVAPPHVRRQRRPVGAQVHVLLDDRDGSGRRRRGRQQRPGGAGGDDDLASGGPQPPQQLQVGPQARRPVAVVLGMRQDARQRRQHALGPPALGAAAVVERGHGDPGRKREERPPPSAALERDHLDLARLSEVAGQRQRGADRAAHGVRVAEQDPHRGRARRARPRPPARAAGGRARAPACARGSPASPGAGGARKSALAPRPGYRPLTSSPVHLPPWPAQCPG